MAKQLWLPGADRSQTYDSKYPGMVADRIDVGLLHSTEGVSWPPYAGGASAPNLTIWPDWAAKKVYYRQHFQANRSSRALAGYTGGLSNNRFHVFQIEICGTSGWATPRNPRRDYTLDEKWYVPGFPDWLLAGIAYPLRWLNQEWGVPLTAPFPFLPFNNSRRMTEAQWKAFKGICGHQHVPHNDHTDPGSININRILELARGGTVTDANTTKPTKPAPVPAPQPKEDPMPSPADLWKYPLDLSSTKKTGDTKPAGEQLAEANRQATYATNEARESRKNTERLIGMVAGLTSAVEQLAKGQGVNPDLIKAAVTDAVNDTLKGQKATVTLGGE